MTIGLVVTVEVTVVSGGEVAVAVEIEVAVATGISAVGWMVAVGELCGVAVGTGVGG